MAQHLPVNTEKQAAARRRFLEQLPDRVKALEQALSGLSDVSDPATPVLTLRRRLQAMVDAAAVLDLSTLATAFASVESSLVSGADPLVATDLAAARETLRLIPALAPSPAPAPPTPQPDGPQARTPGLTPPASTAAPKTRTDDHPPSPPAATVRAARGNADVSRLAGRHILIADDDPAAVAFLERVLQRAGARVSSCHDGLTAWRLAQELEPDLILLDMAMPHLDGFGLCQNLKRDVLLGGLPVVLLACRDDELRRAQDLGARADGYLTKNASERVVLERCSEPLNAIAGLERRLRELPKISGRLDGVTAYALLNLVAKFRPNALVTLRDAAFEYCVQLGAGEVLAVQRHAPARGSAAPRVDGPAVLPGLLGLRSARFSVEEQEASLGCQKLGTPSALLKPHVVRIRRAVHQLQGANLHTVHALQLDEAALRPYTTAAPAVVARVMDKLVQGHAPHRLLTSVSAGLLESILLDMASRGLVRAAFDDQGQNLFDIVDGPMVPFDVEVRTPSVAPLRLTETEGAATAEVSPAWHEATGSSADPAETVPQPPVDDSWDERGSRDEPELELLIRPDHDADEVSRDLSEWIASHLAETPPGGDPVAPKARSRAAADGPSTETRRPATPHALPAEPARRPGPALGWTRSTVPLWRRAHRAWSRLVPLGERMGMRAPGAVSVEPVGKQRSRLRFTAPMEAAQRFFRIGTRPTTTSPDATSSNANAVDLFQHPQDDTPAGDALLSEERAVPLTRRAVEAGPSAPRTSSGSCAIPESTAGSDGHGEDVGPCLSLDETPPPNHKFTPALQRLAVGGARLRQVRNATAPVLILGACAVGAYAVMGRITAKLDAPLPAIAARDPLGAMTALDAAPPVPSGRIDVGPPGSKHAPTPSAPEMQTLRLPMPEGLTLAGEKGLLEVNSAGTHRIYVDGVFVGRGPVRRVPLAPGEHVVKLREGDSEEDYTAVVTSAERTRLEPVSRAAR